MPGFGFDFLESRLILKISALCLSLLCATPAPDSAWGLAGIAHVAFRVQDVSRSRDFYRAIGFEEAFSFADPGRPLVSYIKINDRQFIELYGRADDSEPLGLMHVCYESADIQSLWADYTKRGIDAREPRKARAGNLLFVIHDPENQIVEFTQYLPGSLHFEDRGRHLGQARISQQLISATVPVHDVAGEFSFYTEKPGFEKAGGQNTLRLPGDSGHELRLAPATSPAHIAFKVSDLGATIAELRRRSFSITSAANSVSIADPDNNFVVFVQGKSAADSPKTPRSKN